MESAISLHFCGVSNAFARSSSFLVQPSSDFPSFLFIKAVFVFVRSRACHSKNVRPPQSFLKHVSFKKCKKTQKTVKTSWLFYVHICFYIYVKSCSHSCGGGFTALLLFFTICSICSGVNEIQGGLRYK